MGMVVEINGYKAVGKSSLIAGLRRRFPDAVFREGFRKIRNGLDLSEEDQFYENEKVYIKREVEEFNRLISSGKLVILLRGPEECLFFARNAPRLKYGKDWNVDENIGDYLSLVEPLHADHILWLDASDSILKARKEGDRTKPRLNMESWNRIWNPHLGNYIKALPYTTILDTDELSQEQVLDWTVRWILERMDARRELQTPDRIYIETTNACNARCIMCPHARMTRPVVTMKECVFEKIVGDLSQMDLQRATVFLHKEGEPFMDPDICRRIRDVRTRTNCREVAISTNASLLTHSMAWELLRTGIDTVYLSIDGATKETYEKVRVGLCYETVLRNVQCLFAQMESSRRRPRIVVQMLDDGENADEIAEFEKRWSQYPCEVCIKRMHSYLDGGRSTLSSSLRQDQQKACTDPFNMIVLYADGNAGCCCWDYDNALGLGSVLESSILELFNGEKARRIRKIHATYKCRGLTPCNRCLRVFGNDLISGRSGGVDIEIQ